MVRLVLAVAASSLAVVPLFLVVIALSGGWDSGLLNPSVKGAFIIALAGVVVVGLPVHLALTLLKRRRALFYVVAGFIAPGAIFLIPGPYGEEGFSLLGQAVLMGLFGAYVALVFWGVAVWQPRGQLTKAEPPNNRMQWTRER